MGQKVNPIGFRLAVTKDWRSKWYATGKDYATKLHEDLKIRKFIKDFTTNLNSDLKGSTPAISRITIERAWNSVRVTIATARPGLVIGPKGKNIEEMTSLSVAFQWKHKICWKTPERNWRKRSWI